MKEFFKELSTEMKAAVIIVCVCFVFGGGYLVYQSTFGVASSNIQRQIFEGTEAFVQGKISDLARYKFEYSTTESQTAKKAIEAMVIDNFSGFNLERIPSLSLRVWATNIINR